MGAGVVKPEQNGFSIHIRTGTQASNMGGRHSAGLKCEECANKFSLSRKRLSCKDCERNFCSLCSMPSKRQCKKCHILLSGNFTRSQLLQWKPKDLKALLHKHDINTTNCREKDELIDLIFHYFAGATSSRRDDGRGSESAGVRGHNTQWDQNLGQSNTNEASQSVNQNGAQSETSASRNNEPVSSGGTQSNGTEINQSELEPTELDEGVSQGDISRIALEDIRSEEHIEQLSIKCLKRLLLNNFVDYKGCCERWELQERVKRLWNSHQTNKQKAEEQRKISDIPSSSTLSSAGEDDDLCKVCMDATIDCVLLECGHMVTCTKCGKQLSECPICRQYVVRAVHIFKA